MTNTQPKIPFGIRINDDKHTPILPREITPQNYGRRCNLMCPECGGTLLAVRKSKADPSLGIAYFKHDNECNTNCQGYGEKSSHMLAERIFTDCIGEKIKLPCSYGIDAFPHISRYTDSGNQHALIVNDEIAKTLCLDYDDDGAPIVDIDDSNSILSMKMTDETSFVITAVNIEGRYKVQCDDNTEAVIIPDVVLTLTKEINGKQITGDIPVEIRWSHKKELKDVVKYSKLGMSVLEISISDIDITDDNVETALKNRLLGSLDANHMREWLYNAATYKKLFRYEVIFIHDDIYKKNKLRKFGIHSIEQNEIDFPGEKIIGFGTSINVPYLSYATRIRTIITNNVKMSLAIIEPNAIKSGIKMNNAANYVNDVRSKASNFINATANDIKRMIGDDRWNRYLAMKNKDTDDNGLPAAMLFLSNHYDGNVEALNAGLLKYRTGYCMDTKRQPAEWWNYALRSFEPCTRCKYFYGLRKYLVTITVPSFYDDGGDGEIYLVASMCTNPKNATRYGFFLDKNEMIEILSKRIKYCDYSVIY